MRRRGFTLIELVMVITLAVVLAAIMPALILQGARTFVFLPKAQLANQVATDSLHALVEGSFSTLPGREGTLVRGLRFAARERRPGADARAIWLAEASRIGYLLPNDSATAADNLYVVVRLDGHSLKRRVLTAPTCTPSGPEESLPPGAAAGPVQVVAPSGVFRYYTVSGVVLSPPGCVSSSTIRRVEVAFVAQTGAGVFDQADASERVTSSVAIRFP